MARRTQKLLLSPRLPLAAFPVVLALLALVPSLSLTAFHLGGEKALVAVSFALPIMLLGFLVVHRSGQRSTSRYDPVTGLAGFESLESDLSCKLKKRNATSNAGALFHLQIDAANQILSQHGQAGLNFYLERLAQRLIVQLGKDGKAYCVGDGRFAMFMTPSQEFDLATALQLAARMQSVLEAPIIYENQSFTSSCTIGFCLTALTEDAPDQSLLRASEIALKSAIETAPSTIRSYTAQMGLNAALRSTLAAEAEASLQKGEIVPFFQPQISALTGAVTGFEVLARWNHPKRGLLAPAAFLPALEDAGQMHLLGEVMLYGALGALKKWDAAGFRVPCVSVNVTAGELRNSQLSEKIRWDLDRFDLPPDRLCIEVLESIVAHSTEDAAAENLAKLSQMGCQIDLDDFGTGHASITSIRRFSIARLKIDRSFVSCVDCDEDQQDMIGAIQKMADKLKLETLAEGVETEAEMAVLAKLGCTHIQGFGIARPMPFTEATDWLAARQESLAAVPKAAPPRWGESH